MGCTHPKIRLELPERYKNMQGGWSYKSRFEWSNPTKKFKEIEDQYRTLQLAGKIRKWDLIPCGKCLGCFLEYARDKAVQLSIENQNPEYAENEKWFLTFTYDDTALHYHQVMDAETGELHEGASVYLRDVQNWIKRVRKALPNHKIRYMAAREYGKDTLRPHYHLIIFGLPLQEDFFIKIGNNTNGDALWTSPELDQEKIGNKENPLCWKVERNGKLIRAGNIQIGKVTFQSISYVARYTMKKANKEFDSDWWYAAQGLDREGISQSQDLGKWYYDLHKHEIYENDSVPVLAANGKFSRPPRSFDRRYKKEFPKEFAKTVRKRKKQMLYAEKEKDLITDMSWNERLYSEELKKQEFKDLRGAI